LTGQGSGNRLSATMKPLRIAITVIALCLTSQAQTPKPEWPTLTWKAGTPYSDFMLMQGREVKSIAHDNGTAVVVAMDDDGKYLAFLVYIVNKSPQRFIVNPAACFARIEAPRQFFLLTIPVEKVAKSIENEGRWRSALGLFLAGMAQHQTTGTVTDSYGNQSTVTLTEQDRRASQNAQRAARERSANNQSRASIIRDIGLRSNTVFPDTELVGWIFFEKKKFTSLTVGIFTGLAMYEFPFTKKY
jgi:hypothetical protein